MFPTPYSFGFNILFVLCLAYNFLISLPASVGLVLIKWTHFPFISNDTTPWEDSFLVFHFMLNAT